MCSRQMSILAVGKRSNQRPVFHADGKLREMLADLDARNRRRNRFEFTANLGRSFGLHIEAVDVTCSAREQYDNHRFRSARGDGLFAASARFISTCGRPSPNMELAPTCRNARREGEGWNGMNQFRKE